jgi:ERCC4-type nuclease
MIEIDYREKHLIELFAQNNIEIIVKNLDLGDIIIKDEEDNIKYIIERKTIDDLCCSILDGRYREQRQRLLSNYDPNNILYIIEGTNKVYSKTVPYKTVMSSLLNLNLRDKISVIRTLKLMETFTNILLIEEKVKTNKINIQNSTVEENLVKVKKKDNMDEKMYFLAILTQIPNCSMIIAKKIHEHYPSILSLLELYHNNETDKIKDIMIGKKKIGPKLTERIFTFLFHK